MATMFSNRVSVTWRREVTILTQLFDIISERNESATNGSCIGWNAWCSKFQLFDPYLQFHERGTRWNIDFQRGGGAGNLIYARDKSAFEDCAPRESLDNLEKKASLHKFPQWTVRISLGKGTFRKRKVCLFEVKTFRHLSSRKTNGFSVN